MESQNLNLVKLSFQHLSQITMIIFKLNVPEINQNSQILRKSNLALKVGNGVAYQILVLWSAGNVTKMKPCAIPISGHDP